MPTVENADANPAPTAPTRERLVDAALRLFAANGYEGTSVGEIEEAAGLVPRSGALYKHFGSKRDLLEAALAERIAAIDQIERQMALLPLDDIRSELRLIARLALDELEGERELAKIVMKDGDRFPGIAASFHAAVVERGHKLGHAWLAGRNEQLGAGIPDPEATAEVLVDSLVGLCLQSFMFGPERRLIERERYVDAWVELASHLLPEASQSEHKQHPTKDGPDD